jgi:hypothetical protein
MPKATAVWLIENTSLTFRQIAILCSMHELEVKGIADGDVAKGIQGISPIIVGAISKEEIEMCEKNPNRIPALNKDYAKYVEEVSNKKARYTPIARRQEKPDAIFWLIKSYPEISDAVIIKLIGTTKNTIQSIRDKEHWNYKNLRPRDPVLLGICTQGDLDKAVNHLTRERF